MLLIKYFSNFHFYTASKIFRLFNFYEFLE